MQGEGHGHCIGMLRQNGPTATLQNVLQHYSHGTESKQHSVINFVPGNDLKPALFTAMVPAFEAMLDLVLNRFPT